MPRIKIKNWKLIHAGERIAAAVVPLTAIYLWLVTLPVDALSKADVVLGGVTAMLFYLLVRLTFAHFHTLYPYHTFFGVTLGSVAAIALYLGLPAFEVTDNGSVVLLLLPILAAGLLGFLSDRLVDSEGSLMYPHAVVKVWRPGGGEKEILPPA